MGRSRPSQTPPEGRRKQEDSTAESGQPSQGPPSGSGATSEGSGEARPRDLTAEEMAISASGTQAAVVPTMEPPQAAATGGEQGITAWISNKRVTALWSINQNRNVWIAIDGVGWRRLSATSDSATEALTILSAVAKQTQSPNVSYREESDGMIHEIYVW